MLSLTLTLGAKNRGKENNLKERIRKQGENEKRAKSTSRNSDIKDNDSMIGCTKVISVSALCSRY